MISNPLGLEISEEAAEKLEVVCGFCEKRIAIRSLEEHVKVEHADLCIRRTSSVSI